MYKLGAKDVQLVTIIHDSDKYAHCVVMWHNRIFDATADPPVYNMDRNKYYNFIKESGFKLWIAHSYIPSNESLQKQSLILIVNNPEHEPVCNIENTMQIVIPITSNNFF